MDPPGLPQPASRIVMRGGSWCDDPLYLRSAERQGPAPSAQMGHEGFRVALAQSPATPD